MHEENIDFQFKYQDTHFWYILMITATCGTYISTMCMMMSLGEELINVSNYLRNSAINKLVYSNLWVGLGQRNHQVMLQCFTVNLARFKKQQKLLLELKQSRQFPNQQKILKENITICKSYKVVYVLFIDNALKLS